MVNRRSRQKISLPFAGDLPAESRGAEICNREFALIKGYIARNLRTGRACDRKLFNGYSACSPRLQQVGNWFFPMERKLYQDCLRAAGLKRLFSEAALSSAACKLN